jgi:ABC-2 type transport system ATP-binding protein
MTALKATGLAKSYKSRQVVRDLSLELASGEVVGLLGPNGAGKTTCVKILATLLAPTSGSVRMDGVDIARQPRYMQRVCGVTFAGDRGLYTRLSARDNLRFFGTMYGLSGRTLRDQCDKVLAFTGLGDRAGDRVEVLSHGMRQRLHIARAILHSPRILLLDEPSSGLDPIAAGQLRDMIRGLAAEGNTILLATHNLAEAEELCSRVVILRAGRVVRSAPPAELRRNAGRVVGSCVEFVFGSAVPSADVLAALPGRRADGPDPRSVRMYCEDPAKVIQALLASVGAEPIEDIRVTGPSLHDAYLDAMADEPEPGAPSARAGLAGSAPTDVVA